MKLNFVGGLSVAMLLLWPVAANAQETLGSVEIVSVSVVADPSPGNFMLIDSRMTETNTAAVFAGVVGAVVNSAINADEDEDKADRYRATASELEVASLVEEALLQTLTKRDFPVSESAQHKLKIEVKDWGLTRISFHQPEATVFLKVRVVMQDGRKVIWDTHMKDSGNQTALLADITNEAFSEQMRALAAKTGKRIAYEIIYR